MERLLNLKEGDEIKLKVLSEIYHDNTINNLPMYSRMYKYFGENLTILYGDSDVNGKYYYIKEDNGTDKFYIKWFTQYR
jgi:hypothetical protein